MRKNDKRSKRIRFFLFSGFLLATVVFLVLSSAGRKEFSPTHQLALQAFGTIQDGINQLTDFFGGIQKNYLGLIKVREENLRLREEIKKYQELNNEYREAVATNVRLEKLLKIKETLPPPTLTAEIIAMDPSHWFKTATIDRGSSDGVQSGMPVIADGGVAGQVISTSQGYAKIMLSIDPNSAIDVLVQRTRVQGVLRGDGSQYRMDYVLKNADIQKGDWIVTSGIGGIFPKGVAVGQVSSVEKSKWGMFQNIVIQPTTDFARLEHVVIVLKRNSLAE